MEDEFGTPIDPDAKIDPLSGPELTPKEQSQLDAPVEGGQPGGPWISDGYNSRDQTMEEFFDGLDEMDKIQLLQEEDIMSEDQSEELAADGMLNSNDIGDSVLDQLSASIEPNYAGQPPHHKGEPSSTSNFGPDDEGGDLSTNSAADQIVFDLENNPGFTKDQIMDDMRDDGFQDEQIAAGWDKAIKNYDEIKARIDPDSLRDRMPEGHSGDGSDWIPVEGRGGGGFDDTDAQREEDMMNDVGQPDQEEVSGYLDALRESGQVNMFGASAGVKQEFPELSDQQARDMTTKWMQDFGKDKEPRIEPQGLGQHTTSNDDDPRREIGFGLDPLTDDELAQLDADPSLEPTDFRDPPDEAGFPGEDPAVADTPQGIADRYKAENPNWDEGGPGDVMDWMQKQEMNPDDADAVIDAVRGGSGPTDEEDSLPLGPDPANFTPDEKDAVLSQGIPEEDVSDFMAGQGTDDPAGDGMRAVRDDDVVNTFDNLDAGAKTELLEMGGLGEFVDDIVEAGSLEEWEGYQHLTEDAKKEFLRNAIDSGYDLNPGSSAQVLRDDPEMLAPETEALLKEQPMLHMKDPENEDTTMYGDATVETFHTEAQAQSIWGNQAVQDEDSGLWYGNNDEWQRAHGDDVINIQTYATGDEEDDLLLDEDTGLYMTDMDWQRAHGGGERSGYTYHLIKPELEQYASGIVSPPDDLFPEPSAGTTFATGVPDEDAEEPVTFADNPDNQSYRGEALTDDWLKRVSEAEDCGCKNTFQKAIETLSR